MSDCGTGHFIESDDPLRLKWRSGSLRAQEILHRKQGNLKEITVPADFTVSLTYVKTTLTLVYTYVRLTGLIDYNSTIILKKKASGR